MLSKKSKYAIKALFFLAKNHSEKSVLRISEISEKENIPRKFLETILLELRNKKLVNSKKGSTGGYYLAREAKDIFLSEVIRISGGPIALIPCVSLNFYEACEECVDERICALHEVMEEVRHATLEVLAKTSIQDLVDKEEKLNHLLN
jgi:Rrf2 family protein